MTQIDPPFNSYALPPAREAWREKARGYENTRLGRLLISRARKKAMAGETGPFDVKIDDGVFARLYPATSRCEKRAFAGVQIWDGLERDALKAAIQSGSKLPFTFVDVGANVGLYSLYAHAYAKSAERDIRIIAIEPSIETCGRLETNIAASKAQVQIIRAAISDKPGTAYLSANAVNRGEAKLEGRDDNANQEMVVVDTLTRIFRTQGLTSIDAMKVDIEGHDLKALKVFFEDAASSLHPRLLILETGETGSEDSKALIALCQANDYIIEARTKLNTIFGKK